MGLRNDFFVPFYEALIAVSVDMRDVGSLFLNVIFPLKYGKLLKDLPCPHFVFHLPYPHS